MGEGCLIHELEQQQQSTVQTHLITPLVAPFVTLRTLPNLMQTWEVEVHQADTAEQLYTQLGECRTTLPYLATRATVIRFVRFTVL